MNSHDIADTLDLAWIALAHGAPAVTVRQCLPDPSYDFLTRESERRNHVGFTGLCEDGNRDEIIATVKDAARVAREAI